MNLLSFSKDYDLIKRVEPCIRSNDGVHFIDCLRQYLEIEREYLEIERADGRTVNSALPLAELLALVCRHRAGNCARALVQGRAGIFFVSNHRLNLPLSFLEEDEDGNERHRIGLPPLHLAAQSLSLGVTEAFLMAGADPNLCYSLGSHHNDIADLPLSLALQALSSNRCVTDWSVEKSVPKLIYIPCLQELKEPLDTIRILASRTEHLEKLCLRYAEQGQVVQLTVLLLVAWNELVTPYVDQEQNRVEFCPIGQYIMKQLQSLSSNQQMMTTRQRTSYMVKLQSAWQMLKLLESKYHQIDDYLIRRPEILDDRGHVVKGVENHEVPFLVASCTGIGGPEDVNCDDIQCLMPRLNPKQKGWLDRALRTYSGSPAVYSFGSRKGFAATTLLSKSLHTSSNPNFTNHKGWLTLTTKVEKPAFRQLLPTARTCAYLVSMVKRSFK